MPEPLPQATIDAIHQHAREGVSIGESAHRLGISGFSVQKYRRTLRNDCATELRNNDVQSTCNDVQPEGETETERIVRQVLAEISRRGGDQKKPEIVRETPYQIVPPGKTTVVRDEHHPERTAFLSDLHQPFLDHRSWPAVMAALRDYRPDLLILGGDLFDCYSISDHDKEPGRVDTLQDEFDAARETWQELDDLGCTTIYIKGNHEERIDRMQRKNPGLYNLRSMEIAIAAEMPKRWVYYPNQTRYRLGSLSCLHGDLKGRGTSSVHAASGMLRKLRTSCIFGHLHRFQSFYETNADGTIRAGYANGHLSDVNEAKYIAAPDWQNGFSTIDYDWSTGVFSVVPHLVIDGRLRIGGKTYGRAS